MSALLIPLKKHCFPKACVSLPADPVGATWMCLGAPWWADPYHHVLFSCLPRPRPQDRLPAAGVTVPGREAGNQDGDGGWGMGFVSQEQ